jgi:hypothetical protein
MSDPRVTEIIERLGRKRSGSRLKKCSRPANEGNAGEQALIPKKDGTNS